MQSQPKISVAAQPTKKTWLTPKNKYCKVGLVLLLLVILWFCCSIFLTLDSLHSIKSGKFVIAKRDAQLALPFVTVGSFVTFHQLPDFELWRHSLLFVIEGVDLQQASVDYFKLALQNNPNANGPATTFSNRFNQTTTELELLVPYSTHSFIFQKLIKPKLPNSIQQQLQPNSKFLKMLPMLRTSVQLIMSSQHRILIMFQNSDEVRATGGFMGSYALLDLNNGSLAPIHFFDIYDADGQITHTPPAPAGVKEYLSGGDGLRLPNANWNPDFPSSAQDILQLFAQAGTNQVDGLVAINLSVIQELLQITGPLQLPDSKQIVTPDNLAEVARADRTNYFAGSKEKKNFLQSLSTQLRLQVMSFSPMQQQKFALQMLNDFPQKNIQIFFHQPELQNLALAFGASGQVTKNSLQESSINFQQQITPATYFMSVESNVGINKANNLINRSVKINYSDVHLTVDWNWQNHNPITANSPATFSFPFQINLSTNSPTNNSPPLPTIHQNPHNDYINYQRILLPVGTVINSIAQDQKPISNWDSTQITTATGEQFLQIGFLAPVAEMQTSEVILSATLPTSFQLNPTVIIQKQSGIPPTQYAITYGQHHQTFTLTQDQVVQFPP